jgi:hypothetical protein
MVSKSFSFPNTLDDPLTLAVAPAKDETHDQRLLREQSEAQARQISEEIDERIKQDKVAFKKWQKAVKVLLLGQSESGQCFFFHFASTKHFGIFRLQVNLQP